MGAAVKDYVGMGECGKDCGNRCGNGLGQGAVCEGRCVNGAVCEGLCGNGSVGRIVGMGWEWVGIWARGCM